MIGILMSTHQVALETLATPEFKDEFVERSATLPELPVKEPVKPTEPEEPPPDWEPARQPQIEPDPEDTPIPEPQWAPKPGGDPVPGRIPTYCPWQPDQDL